MVYFFFETDITSISPSTGSIAGGLTLTIYGNYFDDRAPYTAPRAFVGGMYYVFCSLPITG